MIKNLEATPLSLNDYTKYLDNSYGCIMNSKLFDVIFSNLYFIYN